jgi:hypothetical protein
MRYILAVIILMLPVSASVQKAPHLYGKELETLFSGATMRGYFVEGGAAWAERTTKSGRVLDLLQSGKHAGAWYVAGDRICYVYFGKPPSTPCYMIVRDGSGLVFYDPQDGRAVARATSVEPSRR